MKSRLFAFVLFLACVLAAHAHPNLQNSMWVVFEENCVHVAVDVSVKEIAVAQQISTDAEKSALAEAAEKHEDYVLSHLVISVVGKSLAGRVVNITSPFKRADPESTFFQYEITYALDGPPPAEVSIFHTMLKEWTYAAGESWNVSYVVRTKRAGMTEVSSRLLPKQQQTTFATGWPGASLAATPNDWHTFREYLRHGVMHILTGYDHLLFVAALVIATVSFWEMVKVIAAFTLAHTLTLGLSVFNVVRLPSSLVEPVIAASIVFVALQNLLRPQSTYSRARLFVAFGFGLVHGLGFAGGLLDAMEGLPSLGIWIALLAFSIGVEVGHQVVVLPLFGALAASRRKIEPSSLTKLLRATSAFIACCGGYYFIMAIHEQSR